MYLQGMLRGINFSPLIDGLFDSFKLKLCVTYKSVIQYWIYVLNLQENIFLHIQFMNDLQIKFNRKLKSSRVVGHCL